MCGITLFCSPTLCLENFNHENIHRRGPDCQKTASVDLSESVHLVFRGSVLHLRGNLTPQPCMDSHGNILLWNGEIFKGIDVKDDENDTHVLSQLLKTCKTIEAVVKVFSRIHGPWSVIYWQNECQTLWFGRDILGRRSLLWHLPDSQVSDGMFVLSSVQLSPLTFEEVPCNGLYYIQFDKDVDINASVNHMGLIPWSHLSYNSIATSLINSSIPIDIDRKHSLTCNISPLNKTLPDEGYSIDSQITADHLGFLDYLLKHNETLRRCSEKFLQVLENAVNIRVISVPMNDARYNHEITKNVDEQASMTEDSKIDQTFCNVRVLAPKRIDGIVNVDSENVSLSSVLDKRKARVAVLFSGGIDSAVLAALAHRCIPEHEPIDLLNVAFEQRPKSHKTSKHQQVISGDDAFSVPDRITGLQCLHDLSPHRHWNFVQINVTVEELQSYRENRVKGLIHPLNTVLDDSIGCALWCAAMGRGVCVTDDGTRISYLSTAKVVLVGMGADEQLAGYSRHRSTFIKDSWPGLLSEIEMEVSRISSRNLGRDDRIISDHAREGRYPFLDESVVSFLNQTAIHHKCDLSLPRGVGEKLLLRLVALRLGLKHAAVLPKRAIQFGSRIAKLENVKEAASQVCTRLTINQS